MQRFQQTKYALGSTVLLTVVLADPAGAHDTFEDLWREVALFEQQFSRFRPDSELSEFNQMAGAKHSITPEFHAMLSCAQSMAQLTGGLYNPFILPALQRAGYKGSWPNPDQSDPNLSYEHRRTVAIDQLQLGSDWAQIPAGTALDFGGIGKGYLLDMLGKQLHAQGISDFWLSLGGDILCAGHDADGTDWSIAIQAALAEDRTVATATNGGHQLAVATSGTTKRRGTTLNGMWHHLIDPRTGEPAKTDIRTATLCATTATEADVFAKCLVIIGSDEAEAFVSSHGQHDALLQVADGEESIQIKKMGDVWSE